MKADRKLSFDDLSPDQKEVYTAICDWVCNAASKNKPILTVGGLAGTGKTSVLSVFAAETELLVAYVAFTGRAASVLGRKLKACGVATTATTSTEKEPQHLPLCTTIHGLLYKPVIDKETEELRGFEKRSKLDRPYDLVVVDEASQLSDEMLADLKVHGVPILAVGDHGQLPPVMSSGSCVANPDLRLEKIHRQAAGNPILRLAHRLRETGELRDEDFDGERTIITRRGRVGDVFQQADLDKLATGILCWTNKTRIMLNGFARISLDRQGAPREGEIVIALKNKPPVYNGMRGVLVKDAVEPPEDSKRPWELTASIEFPDEGLRATSHVLCAPQFNRERVFGDVEELRARGIDVRSMSMAGEFYDFGYALTVHRSQGSGFKHAIVFLDRPVDPESEEWRRWAYTAVTRASERLTILR
jgi:exodeoxyribonuclease-5